MRIENEIKLDFDDVLIRPKRSTLSSRKEVSLERTFSFLHSDKKWTGVPIIASNMDTTGTFAMAESLSSHKMLTALHKHYTEDMLNVWLSTSPSEAKNVFLSMGTSKDEFFKIKNVLFEFNYLIDKIMIDIANGYSEHFLDHIKLVRDTFPDHIIAAGNVVTADMAEALILAGADIVKAGIGSGSACSTRLQTGVGFPQLSSVIECADAIHGLGGHLISDGGCNLPGDFAKAFGGGADFVMSGSFFSAHKESGGEVFTGEDDNLYTYYYGMSSNTAQEKYNNGVNDYRSSEGRTIVVPYKGEVEDTLKHLLGGIRSSCTYIGAKSIKELPKRTTFIRVNNTHNRVFEKNTIRL